MLAQEFVAKRWPHAAPKTRDSMTDALATVIPALTKEALGRPNPKVLRSALRKHILLPADKRPEPAAQFTAAAKWLEEASLPVPDLGQAKVIRSALDALTVNLDGTRQAPTPSAASAPSSTASWSTRWKERNCRPTLCTRLPGRPRRPRRPLTRA